MKVTEENGKVKVYKKGPNNQPTGEALGTHDTDAQAQAQVEALYANEDAETPSARTQAKEADITKCGYEMPLSGPVSFDELEAAEIAEKTAMEAHKATSQFQILARNILNRMDVTDKAAALGKLANDYAGRIKAAMSPRMKEAPAAEKEAEAPQSSLLIWKENDTYRWIAAYSNNFRDEDNPPEIISTQSHKEFDQALEKGEWPMPELWPWHIPYRLGQAHTHAFDEESGFTIAAGTFDKDKGWAAEAMMNAGWTGVSHGMPSEEIRRDEKDNSIIIRHRSREISPLIPQAAANKLSFNVISTKENNMAIPAHKRDEFVKAFGLEKVEAMEKALEGRAKEAQEAGIEQKEQAETPAQAPTPSDTPSARPQAEKTPEQQAALTAQQVADAIIMAVSPLVEEVKSLRDEVKELKRSDAAKVAEKAAGTPAASLESLLSGQLTGLFSKETEVDGRSGLAKSKPKQAPAQGEGGLFFQSWLQQQ